jgi:transcription termination/antitermination protein NusG
MQSDTSQNSWCAVRTKSNFEKCVATVLAAKGVELYLPLYAVRKHWSDRTIQASHPLFPGYVFCKFDARFRTPILSTAGVVSIVSFAGGPALIPDTEISAIQTAARSEQKLEPCPYLSEGLLIRVSRGPLRGIEGILITKRNWRLVISVEMLRRSVAVEIDPDCVTPVTE